MEKSITPAGVVPAGIVEEAWQQVAASFERFCLTAGVATLADMMEQDAARLCGVRYGRTEGKDGYRWGGPRGKLGFHGGKIELARPPPTWKGRRHDPPGRRLLEAAPL